MTKTQAWLKQNGISENEAKKAGLLPTQISNRLNRAVAVLEKNGLTKTQEYRAFKSASNTQQKGKICQQSI